MKIPEEYLTHLFWRRLVQLAEKLLHLCQFPQRRYDDDIQSFLEDAIQETLMRIHEMNEPDEPIRNWPGFIREVMRRVILEKRRDTYRAHESGWERALNTNSNEDDEDAIPLEEMVPDQSIPVDDALELDELLQTITKEAKIIFDDDFDLFIDLAWRQGYSRTIAWSTVKPSGCSKATFFRRLSRLRCAVKSRGNAKSRHSLRQSPNISHISHERPKRG